MRLTSFIRCPFLGISSCTVLWKYVHALILERKLPESKAYGRARTTPREYEKFVFEVICSHIPSYGFSEAPHPRGFGPVEAAQTFEKLMKRLGYEKYYAQGSDWGSFITQNLALFFPQKVKGIHLDAITGGQQLKTFIVFFYPPLLVDSKDYNKVYSVIQKFAFTLRETGCVHTQATKPDTVGVGLNDPPVGLAAYILEKFSTWVNPAYVDLEDGGLTEKFTLDELLTNVTLYWVTGSVTSSVRLYKFFSTNNISTLASHRILVPVAIAAFPHERHCIPESLARNQFAYIVQHTDMPRGSHFA